MMCADWRNTFCLCDAQSGTWGCPLITKKATKPALSLKESITFPTSMWGTYGGSPGKLDAGSVVESNFFSSLTPLFVLIARPDRLLIVHGLIDENVHFHHTAALIDALVAAGKPHRLQVSGKSRETVNVNCLPLVTFLFPLSLGPGLPTGAPWNPQPRQPQPFPGYAVAFFADGTSVALGGRASLTSNRSRLNLASRSLVLSYASNSQKKDHLNSFSQSHSQLFSKWIP